MKKPLRIILAVLTCGIAIFIIAFVLLNQLFGVDDKSTRSLTAELKTGTESFNALANNILSDGTINFISIQGGNTNRCETVNNWTRCPGQNWKNTSTNEQVINLEQVLQAERISKSHFDSIVNFMNAHQLKSIQIPFDCKGCVDFEVSYNGLRYSSSDNYIFETDHEYVIVTRVDKNWFSYERDIN